MSTAAQPYDVIFDTIFNKPGYSATVRETMNHSPEGLAASDWYSERPENEYALGVVRFIELLNNPKFLKDLTAVASSASELSVAVNDIDPAYYPFLYMFSLGVDFANQHRAIGALPNPSPEMATYDGYAEADGPGISLTDLIKALGPDMQVDEIPF